MQLTFVCLPSFIDSSKPFNAKNYSFFTSKLNYRPLRKEFLKVESAWLNRFEDLLICKVPSILSVSSEVCSESNYLPEARYERCLIGTTDTLGIVPIHFSISKPNYIKDGNYILQLCK